MRGAVRERSKAAVFFRRWWMAGLLPLAGLFVTLGKQFPGAVERVYSTGLYPVLAGTLGRLTSLLPFSLVELFLVSLLVLLLSMVGLLIVKAVKVRAKRETPEPVGIWQVLERVIKLVSCILFAFVLLCGLNYYRPEFTTFSGLTVRSSTTAELTALCSELAQEASRLRGEVAVDENGVTKLSQSIWATAREAKRTFAGLADDYAVLPDLGITPKPVLNSWWMSMTQITGVFSPYTYEANVNVAAPDYSIPATMSHELAHTRGFMREDEANFIAYLACKQSGSAEFRYSGVMLALIHSTNRLYAVNRDAYSFVSAQMSEGVHRDFADNNAYWAKFEGPVAAVSTAVNNTYLRANNQSDGVQSYGRMVDLLLADYRARHGLDD